MAGVSVPNESVLSGHFEETPTDQNAKDRGRFARNNSLHRCTGDPEVLRVEAHHFIAGKDSLGSLDPCAGRDQSIGRNAAVDLINQQDRRPVFLRDRLEQRALEKERLGEDFMLLLVERAIGCLAEFDVEELLLVVPLVQGHRRVQALVALEPDQIGSEHAGHDLGHLGLADARVPLDQERLPEGHRKVHSGRDGRVGDVVRGFHQLLDFPDLWAHDFLFYMKPST